MVEVVNKSILEVGDDVVVLSAHPTLVAGGGTSGVVHRLGVLPGSKTQLGNSRIQRMRGECFKAV